MLIELWGWSLTITWERADERGTVSISKRPEKQL